MPDLPRRVLRNESPNASHEIQNRTLHAARQLPSWLTFDVGQIKKMRAELVKLGCRPSPSDSAETLIQDGWATFLLFRAVSEEVGPTGYLDDLGVAVAECIECSSAKMGYPNDEGLPEHPLYDAGLKDGMGVYRFASSPWLADVQSQARKSSERIWARRGMTVPASKPLFHFVLPMKEATFECIGRSIEIRGFHAGFDEAFAYVQSRLSEH